MVLEKGDVPSADGSTKKPKKAKPPAPDTVEWNELYDVDERNHTFRFIPAKTPGVLADLDGNSIPLDCFATLFDTEVQEKLVSMINEFAQYLIQLNNPHREHSRYSNWYPTNRYELLK